MNTLFSVLIVTILLLQLSIAERISEKKCREYSEIRSTKPYPHLVRVIRQTDFESFSTSIGVLISDQYVLTCSHIFTKERKIYLTKNETINIVKRHTHPLYNDNKLIPNYDVELLKLERRVKLDGNHRPACLWTEEKISDTEAMLMKWNLDNSTKLISNDPYSTTTQRLLTETVCGGLVSTHNGQVLCTLPFYTEDNKDWERKPAKGSPIQVEKTGLYIPNNHFILGICPRQQAPNGSLLVGAKTYVHLDWIENIVWPPRNKDCGTVKVQHQGLITFGAPTYHGEFPWHVALQRKEENGSRKYICGGTVLNKNTVLTAAHCIRDENGVTAPTLLVVSLGKYDLDKTNENTEEIRVKEVIPHDNFNLNYLENDIALLKLPYSISFSNYIEPICLTDDSSIFTTEIGVAPGWGHNEHNIPQSLLLKASLPIVSNDDCRNSSRGFFPTYLYDRNFCAGYGNGTNVCSGDSGGGLVFESGGKWYVRGIVSLAAALPTEKRCDISQFVLFTDVTKFYDWIVDRL